jgi:enolase-phosphatase E1
MKGPPRLDDPPAQAVLLDIEGTTTPIEFVYQVLFPYARAHVREFLELHEKSEMRVDLARLRSEHSHDAQLGHMPPAWPEGGGEQRIEPVVAYVHWLMDRDRKSTGLKSLQGKIWEAGYLSGALRGQVYPDVPLAFARWERQKRDICIFSSGSVLAQKLLFAHTEAGDLTKFIRAYFDANIGPKAEAESYRRIALELQLPPAAIAFLSDVAAELDAAQAAGMQTALCVRPGRPQPDTATHPIIRTFDEM